MKKIIVLVVFLFLTLKVFLIYNSKLTFYADDAIYAEIARFWVQGKFYLVFHPTWPPLYPFLTFVGHIFLLSWENSARLVSALSGSAIIIPLYFLGKKFLPKLSALLMAVSSVFIASIFRLSILPQSDMLATTLVLCAVAFFVYRRFNLAAFFFGLTYLTRSEGLMFFGLSFVFLVLSREKIKTILLFLLVFLATISPYLVATRIQTGSFSLSQKASAQIKQGHSFQLIGRTTWIQQVVSVKTPNYKSGYFKGGLRYILEYSDWFWFLFVQKLGTWKNVLTNTFPSWALFISGIGLVTILKRKGTRDILYILFLLVPGVLTTIFATPLADVRYLLWVVPIIVLLLYLGVEITTKFIFKNRFLWISPVVSILFVFMLPSLEPTAFSNPNSYVQNFSNNYYRPEIEMAGNWIGKNSSHLNPKIASRHEGIEFYADGETIYIPQELTLEKFLTYTEENNTDYIAAFSDEISNDKYLSVMLDDNFKSKHLKRVYKTEDKGRIIIIYETSFVRP